MRRPFTKEQAHIIETITSPYPNTFFVFGSRVKGTYKPYSDLDVCYKTALPDVVIADLLEAFEQSDLPFKVDMVSWKRCSPEFKAHIQKDLMPLESLL